MSYFAVDFGSTNIYAAIEQTGRGGGAEPRVLELEQTAADGMSRIYRRALPWAACREGQALRIGERALHLLSLGGGQGALPSSDLLGESQAAGEAFTALLRYVKACVESQTGRQHSRVVLVGIDERKHVVAASLADGAGLFLGAGGFVDWLEAALLDWQHSPPRGGAGASLGGPWLLALNVGGLATGAALLKLDHAGPRMNVSVIKRCHVPWGGRDVDRALAGATGGRPLLPGSDLSRKLVPGPAALSMARAREEILQLLEDNVPPGQARASALGPGGEWVELGARELGAAVRGAASRGLRPHLEEIILSAGETPGVLLVGEGSRPACLAAWLKEEFGAEVWQPRGPGEALARGAVLKIAMRRNKI